MTFTLILFLIYNLNVSRKKCVFICVFKSMFSLTPAIQFLLIPLVKLHQLSRYLSVAPSCEVSSTLLSHVYQPYKSSLQSEKSVKLHYNGINICNFKFNVHIDNK